MEAKLRSRKALFIGGTGTISMAIVRRLAQETDWEVWLLNRGNRQAEVPAGVHTLVADINDEAEVLRQIGAFGLKHRCTVTSFQAEHLDRVKALDPTQKVGLLTREIDEALLRSLKAMGAEQICPRADLLTPELVRRLHGEGFSVRAWGVRDEAVMERVLRCGADGMTVNFPDKLRALLDRETP